MAQKTPEALRTAHEVTPLMGVRASTVYDSAYRGDLPVVRLWEGRRRALVRFRRADIPDLLRARTVPARANSRRHRVPPAEDIEP